MAKGYALVDTRCQWCLYSTATTSR